MPGKLVKQEADGRMDLTKEMRWRERRGRIIRYLLLTCVCLGVGYALSGLVRVLP